VRVPRQPGSVLTRSARSLQSHIAIRPGPFAIARQRLRRAAAGQCAEPSKEISGNEEAEEKDPIRRGADVRRKLSAIWRELFGSPRTWLSEMSRLAHSSAALRRQTGTSRLTRWRDGCGGPTSQRSFPGLRVVLDRLVPFAVERPGPCSRDGAMNHGAEAAFFE